MHFRKILKKTNPCLTSDIFPMSSSSSSTSGKQKKDKSNSSSSSSSVRLPVTILLHPYLSPSSTTTKTASTLSPGFLGAMSSTLSSNSGDSSNYPTTPT